MLQKTDVDGFSFVYIGKNLLKCRKAYLNYRKYSAIFDYNFAPTPHARMCNKFFAATNQVNALILTD